MFARRRDELERAGRPNRRARRTRRRDPPQDLERAVAKTLEAFGGLDILVWNSGGPPPGTGMDVTRTRSSRRVELMLQPARAPRPPAPAAPRARAPAAASSRSRSLAAKEPTAHLALSNMLRPPSRLAEDARRRARPAGDHRQLRRARPHRDGPARPALSRAARPSEQLAEIPLRRWGEPREFGDVVCFLASDRARYVSGQTLVVDGGLQRALF